MGFDTFLFAAVSATVVLQDVKRFIIPDKIMLPSIAAMAVLKYYTGVDLSTLLICAGSVFALFVVMLFFIDAFGGGDLRFGIFCALYLASFDILWFFVIAGAIQLLLLLVLRRKFWAFAPAMSIAALTAHSFSDKLWGILR